MDGPLPETTNVCPLRLVEPVDVRAVTREDFPDIDDETWERVVKTMEGDDV